MLDPCSQWCWLAMTVIFVPLRFLKEIRIQVAFAVLDFHQMTCTEQVANLFVAYLGGVCILHVGTVITSHFILSKGFITIKRAKGNPQTRWDNERGGLV